MNAGPVSCNTDPHVDKGEEDSGQEDATDGPQEHAHSAQTQLEDGAVRQLIDEEGQPHVGQA